MAETSILLIGDNAEDVRLIDEMLSSVPEWPHQLHWMTCMDQALELLSHSPVDAVLLDINLPGGYGSEPYDRICQVAPDVPVVILSEQSADRAMIETLLRKGVQDYLVKGEVDSNLLCRSLRYAIERKTVELKLKEALRVRSDFLSIVSHELRTPLTAIKGGIGMVLNGVGGEVNEEHAEYLTVAEHNVDRLTRLINNILDFQKIEAGKVQYQYDEARLNEIVLDTYHAMLPIIDHDRIELVLDLDRANPVVLCDRDAITQVLTNLINNAAKFTGEGTISIRTQKQDERVCLQVSDTGPGIPDHELPRLFHEFEQLPSTKKYCKQGTGLGLVIAQRIVHSHQGHIEVESQVGEGTCFKVFLPCHVTMSNHNDAQIVLNCRS